MIIAYFNRDEFIVCEPSDEVRVRADFFKTRNPDDFQRVVAGDYVYGRATAARFQGTDGNAFGPPALLVSTNLSDHLI